MGVDVTPTIYVGKWVENAEDYLVEKGILKEGELEEKYDGDLGWMPDCPLEAQAVSYYSDEGYYVGFDVNLGDYSKFDEYKQKFKELTGEDAEVCLFSQWH